MKKLLSLLLIFVMLLSLCACAGTEVPAIVEEEETTQSPDELLQEALVGQWQNVCDGDIYTFNDDGTGTHGEFSITYRVEDEVIYIVEGVASMEEDVYTLDTSGNVAKLVPEDRKTYFVAPENYDAIAQQLRAEYLTILQQPEYWSNTQGLNYVMFTGEGSGWFLLSDITLTLNWEWLDNNTIKLSFDYNGTTYSSTVDIVVGDNGPQLINAEGVVMYLPRY